MNLLLVNEQDKVTIKDELIPLVEMAIRKTLEQENVTQDLEISMLIVDDAEIRLLNQQYRGKDTATDVLSFPLHENKKHIQSGDMLGDIVISAERVLEQSKTYGHSFEREFCFLTVHSMLHLLGYDHEIDQAQEKHMRLLEEKILLEMRLTRS